ncbi:sulfatase-like hydrolase/transferase [Seonamhaeicola maritimus]|uniref:Sulfatase-like hydrolase/transferase n=1 Tax=Seonamhaeicola maritimus TaxID=2591822 RepID=A0A5C7GK76_9FLAO|nr:sulfatase-like hydrolase/transferase [Seonamhaeicola maritimus]TXG38401.1 sulfatase-like hydrolase/transferase [Seonamhaeicola maritimus]
MTRKIIAFCLLGLMSFQLQAQRKKKPNVLVIYTDDHRYSGVHALGGQAVVTPALDNLAHNGITFTNAYLQGAFSGATCVPSRAMLLTGRNLFQLDGIGRNIPTEHTLMGEAFMDGGYYAYHVGKWHQDHQSLARSANYGAKVSGTPAYLTDQYRMPYSDWEPEGKYKRENCYLLEFNDEGEVIRRPITKDDKRGPTGTEKTAPHVSEVLADEASRFISDYDKKKPFFMYLAFPTPHDPRQAPKKFKDMYPEDEIALLPSYMPQHPFDNGHIVLRDEQLAEWPRTNQIAKQHLSDYYAIISHLDAQIGRVIAALKETGQYENTIIVMAGDSGLAVGNHGLLGKQNIYNEDGIHIPLIISGGLIEEANKGRREGALCYNYDVMPTICEMAGISTPASVTGSSLMPVINNEKEIVRDYTYHAYRQHQRAYRKGDYKLIEYVRAPDKDRKRGDLVTGSKVTQLFNIAKDPWETFNLADFPEYTQIVAQLRKEMKAKAIELGDVADGKRTNFDFWKYYNPSN